MAENNDARLVITKPGVLVLREDLPTGSSIVSFTQDETVVQVSCGYDNSASVVCESGRVYSFCVQQEAMNGRSVSRPWLYPLLNTCRITQAARGYQYIVFLTDQGRVYSCGNNQMGQLGLGHRRETPTPVLVAGLPTIKKVAAGCYHTVVLATCGEVWACGLNEYGQLGLGHKNERSSFTFVPNLPEEIVDISCGAYHTGLISASGVLLMAGLNGYRQLGLGAVGSVSSFRRVSLPSTAVASVSCGFNHTVALGVDGTTWAWGRNDKGQLGTSATTKRAAPTRMIGLEGQTVTQVIAGWGTIAVLTRAGDVFVCGQGTSGELGQGNNNLSVATLLLKSPGLVVQQVALAETYSLLLITSVVAPSAQRGTKVGQDITDLEQSIMRTLECPVCFKVMCAPIRMCTEGHSLCNACRSDDRTTVCPVCRGQFSAVRNLLAEGQSAAIRLPCTKCLLRMPACELEGHGAVCPRRGLSPP